MSDLSIEELLEEEGFGEVARKLRRLKWHKSKKITFSIYASGLVILLLAILAMPETTMTDKVSVSFNFVKAIASFAFTYCVALLGFLIAGFAIFTASNFRDFFTKLALVYYPDIPKDLRISQFKFVFFAYLSALFNHILLLGFSLVVSVFATSSTLLFSTYFNNLPRVEFFKLIINCGLLVGLSCLFCLALINIRTFVWNLYQVLVLQIVYESRNS